MSKLKKIKNEIGLYQYSMSNGDITYYFKIKDAYGKTHDVKVGRHSEGFRIVDARNQRIAAIAKDKDNPKALLIQKQQKKNIITFQDLADRYYKDKAKMNGTWLYKDLALDFFRYLDPVFAVECDQILKQIISQSHILHIERERTKFLFYPLTDTIKNQWISNQTDEQAKRWAYQIVMDLANLKAIEMTSKDYKKIHNISDEKIKEDKKISIRDYMSQNELDKIKVAEEDINGLIKYGRIYDYKTLKDELLKLK